MDIPNIEYAIEEITRTLIANPSISLRANDLGNLYANRRGLMIVDVVASRQRRYESQVLKKILPMYVEKSKALTLAALADEMPIWLPLRNGEAETMQNVALNLLKFGRLNQIEGDESICKVWASNEETQNSMLDVRGIGPALLEYLRMLCGANTLKVDVRVLNGLSKLGLPVNWFSSDGILILCKELARKSGCTLVELDQVLWQVIGQEN